MILVSLGVGAVLYPALLHLPIPFMLAALLVGGVIVGLAPGPVVAMPGRILPPEARAFGTGVFYSIYYVQMMLVLPLAGTIADRVGDVGVAFILGGLMMALAAAALAVFVGTATPPRTAGTLGAASRLPDSVRRAGRRRGPTGQSRGSPTVRSVRISAASYDCGR